MSELSSRLNELATKHPSRYSADEKTGFLLDTKRLLKSAGYTEKQITEQRLGGIFKSRNLIIGNENAEYLITAHYDTPGKNGFLLGTSSLLGQTGANIVMMLPALPLMVAEGLLVSRAMDCPDASLTTVVAAILIVPLLFLLAMIVPMLLRNRNNRNDNTSGVQCVLQCALYAAEHPELLDRCCFVLFDNEEWGLIGSQGFASQRKKRGVDEKKHFYINLDCVGVGEVLAAVTTEAPKERCEALTGRLSDAGLPVEKLRSQLVFMSDHASFTDSVMLCYMNRSKLGPLYIPNIHSDKDTESDDRLVVELADRLTEFIISR